MTAQLRLIKPYRNNLVTPWEVWCAIDEWKSRWWKREANPFR